MLFIPQHRYESNGATFLKHKLLKFSIASLICLTASQTFAHEGVKYDCTDKDIDLMVNFFEDENRAQISHDGKTYGVLYNGVDGYLNVFLQAQFYPKGEKARVYLGSEQFECTYPSLKPKVKTPPAEITYTGRSLGGKVRDGASMSGRQIASLYEGDPITILNDSGVEMNGYDWFEIKFKNGKTGYQWGGIMCSDNLKIDGIYEQCK